MLLKHLLTDHYCKYLSVGVVKQNQLLHQGIPARATIPWEQNQLLHQDIPATDTIPWELNRFHTNRSVQIPYADIFKSFNFFF